MNEIREIIEELLLRIHVLEVITARQAQEIRDLTDRVYQPYRVKTAEEWPADARIGGSD